MRSISTAAAVTRAMGDEPTPTSSSIAHEPDNRCQKRRWERRVQIGKEGAGSEDMVRGKEIALEAVKKARSSRYLCDSRLSGNSSSVFPHIGDVAV